MLFISNKNLDALPKMQALGTRINIVNFNIDTETLLQYIESIFDNLFPEKNSAADKKIKREVFEWFKEMCYHYSSYRKTGYISIRAYTKTLDSVFSGLDEDTWKKKALNTL